VRCEVRTRFFFGKAEEKKSGGMPVPRWEYNIRMNDREKG
jgi:hypothetical protein